MVRESCSDAEIIAGLPTSKTTSFGLLLFSRGTTEAEAAGRDPITW